MFTKECTENNFTNQFNDDDRTIVHYISTKIVDRFGDIVYPEGMDDSDYRKNPIVLFAHDSRKLTIGKNIWLKRNSKGIVAKTQFADTDLGRQLYKLNRDGFLNAWSIGFTIPEGGSEIINGINHIKKWILLEYSNVPIPANPECLNLILKDFGNNFLSNKIKLKEEKMEEKKKTEETSSNLSGKMLKEIVKEQTKATAQDLLKNDFYSTPLPPENFKMTGNESSEMQSEYRDYIRAIVYKNNSLMPEKFKNFLSEGSGSAGGYLVPPEYYDKIISKLWDMSIIRRNATLITSERKDLLIPKLNTLPTFSFVNEGSKKSVSNPSFGQIQLSRHDGGFIILMSKQLIEDSKYDLMGFVTDMASRVISNAIDLAGFKGISPIKGILDASIGTTDVLIGGAPDEITYNKLIEMISAVPSETLPNCKWYMHRSMWGQIKKLKYPEGGEYVLSPDDKKSLTLEGFPVVLSDSIYSIYEGSPGNRYIVFGDLSYMLLMMRDSIYLSVSDSATVEVGGSQINLWQQGLVGLNFGIAFDIGYSYPEVIATGRTGGS